MEGPLAGLRVVDLTRYIPGPYCTMLLGDLGADVVKVEEPPLGDPTRLLPPVVDGQSVVFASLNRNKRSLQVDLRTDEGAAVVRRLAARADVLVEGFRPGVLERRGLGPDELRRENPGLVYCSLTGYGPQGPLAGRAGHDATYVARAGLLAATRDEAGTPVLPGTPVADMSGALAAFGAALALMSVPIARTLAGGGGLTELSGAYPGYRVYRCRDGRFLAVGTLEPKFWEGLCRAVGLPEMVSRQWAEGERRRQTIEAFARVFAGRDRDEWVRDLAAADVCVEPVLELDEAGQQEQAGPLTGPPFTLSHTPAGHAAGAPRLGADTDTVLSELGYAGEERAALREAGVVA
jgi:alpha-methylacyl-CoA racemase